MRLLVAVISIVAVAMGAGVGLADDTDIQFDATATANTGTTAAHTLSISLTVGDNEDRYLALGISLTADTTSNPLPAVGSAIWTVGTIVQTFTAKQSQPTDTGGADTARSVIQERVAPTTGNGTLKVTLDARTVSSETVDTSPTGSTPVTGESLGAGPWAPGVTYTGTLSNTPVVRNTVVITAIAFGVPVTATDDGLGGLTGGFISAGSINYDTGAYSLTIGLPPPDAVPITAAYNYGNWKFSGTSLSEPPVDPSSVTFSATVGGSSKTATDDGLGVLSGDSGNISGTITYSTGAWTLEYMTPPDSSTNIAATYDHQNQAQMVGGVVSLYNVHQTLPSPGGSSQTQSTNLAFENISSDLRQVVFGVVATTGPAGAASERSNIIERWYNKNGTGNTDTIGAGGTAPGVASPSSTLIAWDLTNSRKWAVSGIPIQPPNAPTEARFAKARAYATEAGTLVSWRTAYEVRNLGFRVYREDEHGEHVPLNRSLVAGSALFAGPSTALSVGRSYVFWDSEANGIASPYWLEAVDLDGRTTWYGPFLSEPASGRERIPELGGVTAVEAQSRVNPLVTRLGRNSTKTAPIVKAFDTTVRRATDRVGGSQGQWRLAAAPAARILVAQAGWTRVTRAQLAAAGFDPGPVATSLQLINQGHEEAIRISGLEDGTFDMDDAIEFFAREIDTSSAGVNVYWLTEGVRPGRRVADVPGDSGLGEPAATFPATVTLQDRSLYVAAVTKNGDRDNFYGPVVGAEPVTQVLNVDALPPESDQQFSTLEIALQGVTTSDHRVAVNLNGHDLDEMSFSGSVSSVRSYEIDASWLRLGDNEVTLQALDGNADVSLTDYLRLTWQRPFVAVDDRLEMTAPAGATVRVSGFTGDAIRLFDLSGRYQPVEIHGSVEQDVDGSWAVEAVLAGRAGDRDRQLFAVVESRIGAPAGIEANLPSSWHANENQAGMVIISHSSLLSSAERLAQYRSANGLSTVAIDVADLYDEFSWGIKDPDAIRAFLKNAAPVWKTAHRYVLLMGDASVDPRNYLGFGDRDLVPTKILATNLLKTANDDWFADLDEDGLANLAVGRLPAASLEDADTMVDKIIGYEQEAAAGSWTENLTLVIDEVTGDFDFRAAADALEGLIPVDLVSDRIDLGEVDQVTAHQLILDAFDEGRLLVNYDGHGSQAVWASDEVFENEDALNLENGFKLPLVVAMNCLNGLFQDVYQDSLAESFLINPNGGAVMVWASSALTDPTGQDMMNRDLYRSLFGGSNPSVGDAVLAAKANVTDRDTRNTWILFGDPSMQLKQ